MRERISWDDYYLGIAEAAARRSADPITQVGAVAVRGGAILATGYNGFVSGLPDTPERWERPEKYNRVIHAEMNVVAHAARHGHALAGATVYCTLIPCCGCLQMLVQAGVTEIVYEHGPESGYTSQWITDQAALRHSLMTELQGKVTVRFSPKVNS